LLRTLSKPYTPVDLAIFVATGMSVITISSAVVGLTLTNALCAINRPLAPIDMFLIGRHLSFFTFAADSPEKRTAFYADIYQIQPCPIEG
tara:strand:- start:253 stop:522 length:270 start_codon:yes stop_codon:yes gene_type:complete